MFFLFLNCHCTRLKWGLGDGDESGEGRYHKLRRGMNDWMITPLYVVRYYKYIENNASESTSEGAVGCFVPRNDDMVVLRW